MIRSFVNWLDDRTGLRKLAHEALFERIPGGPRWRYVWGSTLVFAFSVQAITGIFLWMAYSASGQTAWESVYYIQNHVTGGWLLRGIHHFMAQAMVVLLALHLMQVVIDGAYKAPREVNFWLGLILMKIVLGLSLTGYLLPWDQKGYWATRVATNLMGLVPVVGNSLQKLVVGGDDYGHHTLTRFFALHAGVLPGLLVLFLVMHIAVFRKHGIHAKSTEGRADGTFWPEQVLKDGVACLAVLAVVLLLTVLPGLRDSTAWQNPGQHLGAELGAPADASEPYAAARPEWYFLFLFQFLKLFEGPNEFIGAIVIPGLAMGVLFMMPLVGRWKLGHRFNIAFLLVVLAGAAFLTYQAMRDDHLASWYSEADFASNPRGLKKFEDSREFLHAKEQAELSAARVKALIGRTSADGQPALIPPLGAGSVLRQDPLTQGPKLFKQHCASCHSHANAEGQGIVAENPTAPNLYGFGTKPWLSGFFDPAQISGAHYFGNSKHKAGDDGEMVDFVTSNLANLTPEEKHGLDQLISALAAEAQPVLAAPAGGAALDVQPDADISQGQKWLAAESGDTDPWFLKNESVSRCTDCHTYRGKGVEGVGPTLTGWGSRAWMIGMIANPTHADFYGENNDRMPAFAPDQENPEQNRLTEEQIGLIVDWLRGDYFVE